MAGLNPKYVLKNPPVAQAPITPVPALKGAIPQQPAGGMSAGMPPAPAKKAVKPKSKKRGKMPPTGGMSVK